MKNKKFINIFEIAFDSIYLIFAICAGIYALSKSNYRLSMLCGAMILTLGFGDAFHLVPRILSKIKNDQTKYIKQLGFGKMITSITMTIFYCLLFLIVKSNPSTLDLVIVFTLAIIRIVMCLMKQNKWDTKEGNYAWGIYRNVPFTLLGLYVLLAAFNIPVYGMQMGIAIIISFVCYWITVLFASKNPMAGMAMMPKTMAYMWLIILTIKYMQFIG